VENPKGCTFRLYVLPMTGKNVAGQMAFSMPVLLLFWMVEPERSKSATTLTSLEVGFSPSGCALPPQALSTRAITNRVDKARATPRWRGEVIGVP